MSLMQRVRLWLRGAERRREQQNEDFLARNAGWGAPAAPPAAAAANLQPKSTTVDIDGLQAAYLDRSGVIEYYLDRETGDVIESRGIALDPARYRRVPTQNDDDDRAAFLATLDEPVRRRLESANSFRAALAEDRALERSWYNFKNDRATRAIEEWLKQRDSR